MKGKLTTHVCHVTHSYRGKMRSKKELLSHSKIFQEAIQYNKADETFAYSEDLYAMK